eukprot:PRCOL_00005595-RA
MRTRPAAVDRASAGRMRFDVRGVCACGLMGGTLWRAAARHSARAVRCGAVRRRPPPPPPSSSPGPADACSRAPRRRLAADRSSRRWRAPRRRPPARARSAPRRRPRPRGASPQRVRARGRRRGSARQRGREGRAPPRAPNGPICGGSGPRRVPSRSRRPDPRGSAQIRAASARPQGRTAL